MTARAPWRDTGPALAVLGVLAAVGCFAEPKEEPAPNGAAATPASGGAGGANAMSAGGKASSGTSGTGEAAGESGAQGNGSGGTGGEGNAPGTGGSAVDPGTPIAFCRDAVAEPLPARRAITSNEAPEPDPGGPMVLTLTRESLFRDFQKQGCGSTSCHGGEGDPLAQPPDAFQVTLDSFSERPTLGDEALARILSPDPDLVMPPDTPDGDGSTRGKDNPVRLLGERLLAWQNAGFPDSFNLTLDTGPDRGLSTDPYLLSPKLGDKLTNLGSCVPNAAAMLDGLSPDNPYADEMRLVDARFAAMETSDDLPDTLFETDLVSLDSVQLGLRRVFSYAPTYPLYSDHAGKMRHVRVPLGESIRYEETTHDLSIPDNTRFYKTFLKQVTDRDGNVGHRKMETRLIVVRQDEKLPDGSFRPRALRASYAWDRNERMARRVKDPFKDGTPATDRMCPYVVDERVTRDPQKHPISKQIAETCEYMTPAEMADPTSGQIRHYAIPSTQRCDQCHMGSSSRSYILGFTPWQVDRRRSGEGGIYEEPKDDELTQLERLRDYGVISGLEPGQAKLEESQGARKPRNEHELVAQGYMLGNCAFCHNPNGFPVVQNPVLKAFELFPNEAEGGIFQFSLERYSPRAKVGANQDIRLPYITSAVYGDATPPGLSLLKTQVFSPPPVTDTDSETPEYNPFTGEFTFFGPWRSLIWRNVYTPFTYEEDRTIFVHMPRNVAGYDCRAPRIMANWMLSIPSVAKKGVSEQPMFEVSEGDERHLVTQALFEADRRVKQYAASTTGSWCPNDDDIVDPEVVRAPIDEQTGHSTLAAPLDHGISGPRLVPDYAFPPGFDKVPDHAHWVPTDTTSPPGAWTPRRSNWKEIIATREVEVSDKLEAVVDALQGVHLTPEMHAFALEQKPMGIWHTQCRSTPEALASPTVGELLAASPSDANRRWLAGSVFKPDSKPDDPWRVHFQSRGEVVFRQICQNCHGKDADSKSPLAATILELTGGETRVANFVDGLFGPRSAPGAFAREEFLIDRGATPEDWQVRYMLFMGLGGTQATIPEVVLNLVATSPFYGQGIVAPGGRNPNMLESAVSLCGAVLGVGRALGNAAGPQVLTSNVTAFARGTGHYEAWESICSFQNEPVVHAFRYTGALESNAGLVYRAKDDDGGWVYPTDHLVGAQGGNVEIGIQPTNTLPWCFLEPKDQNERDNVLAWGAGQGLGEEQLPFCPPALFAEAFGVQVHALAIDPDGHAIPDIPLGNQEFAENWTRRGAMNAGISAYYYLNGITTGEVVPVKPFDFCRQ